MFGELYFLLEYRDTPMELMYGKAEESRFTMPGNLYIVETMNTADSSIALVDLALRRRFAFVDFSMREEPVKGLLRRWLAANDLQEYGLGGGGRGARQPGAGRSPRRDRAELPSPSRRSTARRTSTDALALAFGAAARRAFSRGLLHGYRTEEDALPAVRGRIRFDDRIRRRFGIPLPVEVRYDEFTADIILNRLVRAAAHRLGRLGLRSREARRRIAWVAESLSEVSLAAFPRGAVPEVRFDRLNEHYRSVVTLARLVLRHGAFEADRGKVRASGFLMDMNQVFQEFVTVALRERLAGTSFRNPRPRAS